MRGVRPQSFRDPATGWVHDAAVDAATAADRAVAHVRSLSSGPPLDPVTRVTLNFHPDRELGGRSVLDLLADSGLYLSQFVTGTGNGGLTARPGGDRWRWEQRIFGGAYDDAEPESRPVYGALNFRGRAAGAASRFGSAHLRLRAGVLDRVTFCFPDSVFEPEHFGVAARMGLIPLAEGADHDRLDDYIEAQVHGGVRIDRDVEALVLDPCYRGTPVQRAADRLPCPVEWHRGFRLPAAQLREHPDYRGREYVELGLRLAAAGTLDPLIIGRALHTGRYDPQALKRVWHYLARFGDLNPD
ncbi:MAG: DUF3626 domain-containing protein [Microlunatus sp.]|nr:DUF3626 domain-containing protein [Microlunatus sp.]